MKFDKKFIFLGGLLIIAILVWIAVFEISNNLEVIFLDVGQGDATLIQYKTQQILIDAGPSDDILEKLGKHMPFWDRTIELAIATHMDADHIKGFLYIIPRYEIEKFLITKEEKDTKTYKKFKELIDNEILAETGQQVKINNSILEILYDKMIIAKLENFLFMADAGFSIENKLNNINNIDILKAGHHGSKNSTSESFLKKVNPRDIIVSAGANNKYGHPAKELLERIKNYNIFFTYNGDIIYEAP